MNRKLNIIFERMILFARTISYQGCAIYLSTFDCFFIGLMINGNS